jgi:hypothetical protein
MRSVLWLRFFLKEGGREREREGVLGVLWLGGDTLLDLHTG